MASTTNYSWSTPDDTALVKDGASAIRTLGSSVDTTVKALNPETTLGDIAYRSSTANVKTRLGIGTTGQVLAVSGGVPAWTTPASAAPASATNRVDTSQSTSSTSYTGLATAQSVTLTTGTKVMVVISARLTGSTVQQVFASYAISGATTVSASETWAIMNAGDGNTGAKWPLQMSYVSYQTVTAGSNTFTMQFRSGQTGQDVTASNREIIVIDLGS